MSDNGEVKKLPPTADLVLKAKAKKVLSSLSFLSGRRNVLSKYPSFDDFVYDLAADPQPSELSGVEYHMGVVRNSVLNVMRDKMVFIGSSVVEELVFESFKTAPSGKEPLEWLFETIRDARLHQPGLLIFPLHSTGILGFGFARAFARGLRRGDIETEFVIPEAGLVFSPQTNSEAGTVHLIKRAEQHLALTRSVPEDNLHHHMRIHPTAWLTRNPLLLVKTRVFSGSTYENQRFLLLKLQISTSLLLFLASLERSLQGKKPPKWTSSQATNNWETLDIHHYLVYQPSGRPGSKYIGKRIPMNVDLSDLAEVSGIGVDFNPAAWKRRPHITSRLVSALSIVEGGYLRHHLIHSDESVRGRVFRKLFSSLGYFRRSFRPLSRPEDRCVNLAIAFETLLTDSYGAPRDTITRRAKLALAGVPNAANLRRAARRVYEARNSIVHTGSATAKPDLRLARTAFTHCFLAVVERIHRLPKESGNPIGDMLGDRFTAPFERECKFPKKRR
jgi:hypothetical protein